jgi:ubiquinone/menaquinone biosynthesis C-methylase UbiE
MDAVSKSNAAEFNAGLDDVFTRISSRYDRLCDVFSLLAHRYWKSTMARQIARDRGSTVLDVASGTGDIAIRVARQKDAKDKVIIAGDICPAMLAIALGDGIPSVKLAAAQRFPGRCVWEEKISAIELCDKSPF